MIDGDTTPSDCADHFAAIAYSPSTKEWGSGYGFTTLGGAQREALSRCGTKDALLVGYACNGWYVALATGEDGSYAGGFGPTAEAAKNDALKDCRKYSKDCRIVACFCAR